MTEVWGADGVVHPATVISAGPMTVTQVKTATTDKYEAVQVGFGAKKESRTTKAIQGHLKASGAGNLRFLKEVRLAKPEEMKVGDKIDVSVFKEGDAVTVSAISKGKGFQGGVKRHGFHGGSRTHGQKHSEREPGTIGGGLRTRVPKGMRMAGRMGGTRVTVENLKVLQINLATNTILISGAVPGRRGTLVEIRG